MSPAPAGRWAMYGPLPLLGPRCFLGARMTDAGPERDAPLTLEWLPRTVSSPAAREQIAARVGALARASRSGEAGFQSTVGREQVSAIAPVEQLDTMPEGTVCVSRTSGAVSLGWLAETAAKRHVPIAPPLAARIVSDALDGLRAAGDLPELSGPQAGLQGLPPAESSADAWSRTGPGEVFLVMPLGETVVGPSIAWTWDGPRAGVVLAGRALELLLATAAGSGSERVERLLAVASRAVGGAAAEPFERPGALKAAILTALGAERLAARAEVALLLEALLPPGAPERTERERALASVASGTPSVVLGGGAWSAPGAGDMTVRSPEPAPARASWETTLPPDAPPRSEHSVTLDEEDEDTAAEDRPSVVDDREPTLQLGPPPKDVAAALAAAHAAGQAAAQAQAPPPAEEEEDDEGEDEDEEEDEAPSWLRRHWWLPAAAALAAAAAGVLFAYARA